MRCLLAGYEFTFTFLLYHSQPESNSRLSEEANSAGGNTSEEAVDEVDLEVQRLLSVYDVVKDDESRDRSGHLSLLTLSLPNV